MAPEYITELCMPQSANRGGITLRSYSDTTKLQITNNASKPAYIEKAFSSAGPRAWNELPQNIREAQSLTVFKTQLKTHLFKKSHLA